MGKQFVAEFVEFGSFSFRYTFSVGKVVRIKVLLKYGICIRFASCCSCTLVVTPFGIFSNCLMFFFNLLNFFHCDSSSALVRSKINSMTFYDAVSILPTDVARFYYRL